MSDENLNPDAPLHIRGLNHLTMPVKDRYRAARFYIVVLGAEAHHESAPDRAAKGLARSLQTGVRLAPGFEIDLFEQSYGQPDWNQSHPHLALDTSAEDLAKWTEHFKKWQVPFVGPMTRAGTKGARDLFQRPRRQSPRNPLLRRAASATREISGRSLRQRPMRAQTRMAAERVSRRSRAVVPSVIGAHARTQKPH